MKGYRNHLGGVRGVFVLGLLAMLATLSALVLSGAGGAASTPKNYTADVSPSPVSGGTSVTFDFAFENLAATQQVGSANISIPATWGGTITGFSPMPSGSSHDATTVFLRNMGLAASSMAAFQITVDVPCVNGSFDWSVIAKQSNNFHGPPGNTFNLVEADSDLTTNVQCGVDLVFEGQPSDTPLDSSDPSQSEPVEDATVRAIPYGCTTACPTVDVDAVGAVTIDVVAGTTAPVGAGSAASETYDLVDGVATISPGPVISNGGGSPVGFYKLEVSSALDPDTDPDDTSDEFVVADAVCEHEGTDDDTCELSTEVQSFGNKNIGVNVVANNLNNDQSNQGATSLLVSSTGGAPPAGFCPGIDPAGPGTQLDIRPLATRTVVTLFIPKQVRQFTTNNGLALMNVCLGSNLEFEIKGGGTSGYDAVTDRWYGILPDFPAFTSVAGMLVPSPSVLSRQSVRGGAEIVFELPYVGLAAYTTNGLAAYDPSWWVP